MSRAREFEHGGAEPQVLSSDFQRAIHRDQVDVYIHTHLTFERAILLALRNSSFAGREIPEEPRRRGTRREKAFITVLCRRAAVDRAAENVY